MDNEFRDDREDQEPEPQIEDFEQDGEPQDFQFEGEEEQFGINWNVLWKIVVHRNRNIREVDPPEYADDAWSLDEKDAPFPFNLEPTWYCAAIIALILLVHCELDTAWLLRHGYRHYLMRISSKTILTVAISILSTLTFEIILNIVDLCRELVTYHIYVGINEWFARRFDWGTVEDDAILFNIDPTFLRRPIRESVGSIAVLAFNYVLFTCVISGGASFIRYVLKSLVSAETSDFVTNLFASVSLPTPTPNTDGGSSLTDLLWEFGVPAYFQVVAAAFMYLTVFLFMSRAETPMILDRRGQDPFSKLAFQLTRSIAMHLLAYTAYQLVCACAISTYASWLSDHVYGFLSEGGLVRKISTRYSPGAGLLIIGSHWLVKSTCRILVRILWPLWIPYIVWLSIKTERYTARNWVIYGPIFDGDMEILNAGNRVTAKAAMTTLFGLGSSWPARMRLSTVEGID